MARYRRIETGTWTDQKYVELSGPPPNGRTLWHYLLTGQRTTIFPGLIGAKEAVIADDLGWEIDDEDGDFACSCLRDAWHEIESRGMAIADWTHGVIVLPRALMDRRGRPRETARPGSPNQFRGWARSWTDVPECELKDAYLAQLRAFAEALDREAVASQGKRKKSVKDSYSDAFEESFSTHLDRGTDSSFTGYEPVQNSLRTASRLTRARARGPVPVPVPEDLDLRGPVSGSGAPPIPEPADRGGGDQAQGGGVVLPMSASTVSALAVSRPVVRPVEPGVTLRRRLIGEFVERVNRVRSELAAGLPDPSAVRPIAFQGQGERDLMDRLKESMDPAADLEHVLTVAEAEMRAGVGDLRWFGWALASDGAWRTKLSDTVDDVLRRAKRTARPASARDLFETLDDVADQANAQDAHRRIP